MSLVAGTSQVGNQDFAGAGFFQGLIYSIRKEVGDDGAVETARTVDDVGSFFYGLYCFWCGGSGGGFQPDPGDGVFAVRQVVQNVFTNMSVARNGGKVNVGRG